MEYALLICLSAAAVSCAAAVYSARAWPIGIRAVSDNLQERVRAMESDLEAALAKQRAEAAANAEFLEAAEGVLQAVETKRRRIAARESKNREPETPEQRRLTLLRQAREQGHAV